MFADAIPVLLIAAKHKAQRERAVGIAPCQQQTQGKKSHRRQDPQIHSPFDHQEEFSKDFVRLSKMYVVLAAWTNHARSMASIES